VPNFNHDVASTTSAIHEFEEAHRNANAIATRVSLARTKLTGTAMQSTSGQMMGRAIDTWGQDFKTITDQLDWMRDNLRNMMGTIANGEQYQGGVVTAITSELTGT
jgi:hypothetical protein